VIQVNWKVTLPLFMGHTLVSDRYLYDTLINVGLGIGLSHDKILSNNVCFSRFFPNPDLIFFLDIPEEIAFSRKDDVPDILYLRERRELYKQFAQIFPMITLDGTLPVDELVDIVMGVVERKQE